MSLRGGKYGVNAGARKRRASRAQSLWSSGRFMTEPHAPAKPVNEYAAATPLNAIGCFWHAPSRNPDFL